MVELEFQHLVKQQLWKRLGNFTVMIRRIRQLVAEIEAG